MVLLLHKCTYKNLAIITFENQRNIKRYKREIIKEIRDKAQLLKEGKTYEIWDPSYLISFLKVMEIEKRNKLIR